MTCKHTLADVAKVNQYGEICPVCLLAQVRRLETALRVIKDMPGAVEGPQMTVTKMRQAAAALRQPAVLTDSHQVSR